MVVVGVGLVLKLLKLDLCAVITDLLMLMLRDFGLVSVALSGIHLS